MRQDAKSAKSCDAKMAAMIRFGGSELALKSLIALKRENNSYCQSILAMIFHTNESLTSDPDAIEAALQLVASTSLPKSNHSRFQILNAALSVLLDSRSKSFEYGPNLLFYERNSSHVSRMRTVVRQTRSLQRVNRVLSVTNPIVWSEKCEVRVSCDASATGGIDRGYGIFAKESISAGEIILAEVPLVSVLPDRLGERCSHCHRLFSHPRRKCDEINCPECGTGYCSADCRDAADQSYHKVSP
jgi:hypothetical protein